MGSVKATATMKVNLKGLKGIKKALKQKIYTKLGIFGENNTEHDEESGLTNAEVGAINLWGSIKKNIPPRNWLDGPLRKKKKLFEKKLSKSKSDIEEGIANGDFEVLYNKIGLIALGIVQRGFGNAGYGDWAPNTSATIEAKGSSQPLVDDAELKRSVDYEVIEGGK